MEENGERHRRHRERERERERERVGGGGGGGGPEDALHEEIHKHDVMFYLIMFRFYLGFVSKASYTFNQRKVINVLQYFAALDLWFPGAVS